MSLSLTKALVVAVLSVNATVAQVNPDINLMAHMVQAEAGGQPEDGQRLVVDVVLNRVGSEIFPDTVSGVILSPGQFAVVSNGAIRRATPPYEIYRYIREEMRERTNTEVFYFTAGGYNPSGEAWQKVGDHYFSKLRKELQW